MLRSFPRAFSPRGQLKSAFHSIDKGRLFSGLLGGYSGIREMQRLLEFEFKDCANNEATEKMKFIYDTHVNALVKNRFAGNTNHVVSINYTPLTNNRHMLTSHAIECFKSAADNPLLIPVYVSYDSCFHPTTATTTTIPTTATTIPTTPTTTTTTPTTTSQQEQQEHSLDNLLFNHLAMSGLPLSLHDSASVPAKLVTIEKELLREGRKCLLVVDQVHQLFERITRERQVTFDCLRHLSRVDSGTFAILLCGSKRWMRPLLTRCPQLANSDDANRFPLLKTLPSSLKFESGQFIEKFI